MKRKLKVKGLFLLSTVLLPVSLLFSCGQNQNKATITLSKKTVTLNQTNSNDTISGVVTLSNDEPPEPITYDFSSLAGNTLVYCSQSPEQYLLNTITFFLNTGVPIPQNLSFQIYATYPKSVNKPKVAITVNVAQFNPSLPSATLIPNKLNVNLDQTNNQDQITISVVLSDGSTPANPTFDFSEATLLPIQFSPINNSLTLVLEQGREIPNDTNFKIYVTYPLSSNTPTLEINVSVDSYTVPFVPEHWDDAWVPKTNLIINGNGILTDVTSLAGKTILHIPDEVHGIASGAFDNNALNGITTVDFNVDDSTCVGIGYRAFGKCSTIQQFVFPKSLVNLGNECFDLAGLLSADFSLCEEITVIPTRAFWYCENITHLVLPPNCITIGDEAFENGKSLEGTITIPKTVKTVGAEAFLNAGYFIWNNTKDIHLEFEEGSELEEIKYGAFSSMTCKNEIFVPASLVKYGNNCFSSNKAPKIHLYNTSSNVVFGTDCFNGASVVELFLHGTYFNYPTYFLRFSTLADAVNGKIYVPSTELANYVASWTNFSSKFYVLP